MSAMDDLRRAMKPSHKSHESFEHDMLCLDVVNRRHRLLNLRSGYPGKFAPKDVNYELEHLVQVNDFVSGYVDVWLWNDQFSLGVEIKSSAEAQHPSAWVRQIKTYQRALKTQVLLVVAHDLSELQVNYFEAACIQIFDWRSKGYW